MLGVLHRHANLFNFIIITAFYTFLQPIRLDGKTLKLNPQRKSDFRGGAYEQVFQMDVSRHGRSRLDLLAPPEKPGGIVFPHSITRILTSKFGTCCARVVCRRPSKPVLHFSRRFEGVRIRIRTPIAQHVSKFHIKLRTTKSGDTTLKNYNILAGTASYRYRPLMFGGEMEGC